ncbi:unnamed protein product [Cunninghamella echinulata]
MQQINTYSTLPFSFPLNKKEEEDILLSKPSTINDNGDHDNEEDEDEEEPKPQKRNNNGRRKIKVEYINDKSRRHITFSKRKAGIMKKAYELSALTGTQVLLIVVSETGLVYTFTTNKLQPLVTRPEGKNLIQLYLNAPDDVLPPINSFQHHLSSSWYTYNHFENIRFSSYNQVSQQGQSKSYVNW